MDARKLQLHFSAKENSDVVIKHADNKFQPLETSVTAVLDSTRNKILNKSF